MRHGAPRRADRDTPRVAERVRRVSRVSRVRRVRRVRRARKQESKKVAIAREQESKGPLGLLALFFEKKAGGKQQK